MCIINWSGTRITPTATGGIEISFHAHVWTMVTSALTIDALHVYLSRAIIFWIGTQFPLNGKPYCANKGRLKITLVIEIIIICWNQLISMFSVNLIYRIVGNAQRWYLNASLRQTNYLLSYSIKLQKNEEDTKK